MLGNLSGWHLVIILAVVVLLFGAAKLPALAKALGQSARILKSEIRHGDAGSAVAADAPAGAGTGAGAGAEGAGVEGDAAHTTAAR